MIYLDYYSTSPIEDEVCEAMYPYLKERFFNPLSKNKMGAMIKEEIEKARSKVAKLINASDDEIIFTSSGTESNNTVIKGLSFAYEKRGKHVITSKSEHHSVLNPMRNLERMGFYVTFLSPDKYGEIKPSYVESAIRDDTMLVSLSFGSVDVGTINNIKEIAKILKKKDILFHTDAVAAVGNVHIDVRDLGVDSLSFSSHIFGGPKGVGGFYLRDGLRFMPLIYGGPQEFGKRAGTENVPGIIGIGVAAELAMLNLDKRIEKRNKLISEIKKILSLDGIKLVGKDLERLPGHLSFIIDKVKSSDMISYLESNDIYVSSGSPCVSYALKASPVLISMRYTFEQASSIIALSTSHKTTEEEIGLFLEIFERGIKKLRR
ncbi:MAG: cysteine desulfurase NifS [Thermodesulfobium narugense]|nr:MAG: cysteine desulfurase NifS [Thermodesulfobium narugense]